MQMCKEEDRELEKKGKGGGKKSRQRRGRREFMTTEPIWLCDQQKAGMQG